MNWDVGVGTATHGYELDYLGFNSLQGQEIWGEGNAETGSGVYPTFYSVSAGVSFPKGICGWAHESHH